jgi:hypothetical protein
MQNQYLPHQYNLSNIIYDTPEVFNEGSDSYRKTIKIYVTYSTGRTDVFGI